MDTTHSKNKTIGLFNDSFPPIIDGVALAVQNCAHWMKLKGEDVRVFTLKAPNSNDDELSFPVYRYTSIPIIGRKPYRLGLPKIDMSFRNEMDQISFKLVHAHSPFSAGNIALNIAKKEKIPFVASFHSKYQDDFERAVYNKQVAKLMVKDVIKFYEMADEVWIPQPAVEETIRKYGYKGKLIVVDNGNDFATNLPIKPIKEAARKKLHINGEETVLLFVGQHIWEKNTRMIIESLALLDDLAFKMYFIGVGYAEDEMRQLVDQLGLSSKVEFLGMITDRDVLKRYYAAADLFLFPSIYDNAPLVVREAAAMHTPSILVKDSTSAEIITDNKNGFLIENKAEALANKIKELIGNKQQIITVGLNASKTIARSWESVTEEVLDRYNHLIKHKWRQ
jgi:glycosyltransferase involved in cell wall biosynthesis